MVPEELLTMNLTGHRIYAHSVGEYYHYRGTIVSVELAELGFDQDSLKLCIGLANVEAMEGDFDPIWDFRYRPSEIAGEWRPYIEFEYGAPIKEITIREESEGMRISFRQVGVVYIGTTNNTKLA